VFNRFDAVNPGRWKESKANELSISPAPMQRLLVIAGLLLLAAGVAWPWLSKIPFGRLPGDIHIVREGFSFHFPVVTCIVISVVLSILFWILRR
jgi:uncharacterized protein HemY